MVLATYDALISALNTKRRVLPFWKTVPTLEGASIMHTTWTYDGFPGAGVVPATGSGTVPTKDTAGALFFPNAGGGDNSYLTKINASTTIASQTPWLVDILWFNSGLSGTSTSPQTINSSALTRYTTGTGVYMGIVCWTPTGTTASNITVSYTNQAGTSGRTTPSTAFWTGAWGGGTLAPTASQIQIIPLQAGDSGVRSVQSVTLSASTLTAGDFGVILFKPLCIVTMPDVANSLATKDLVLTPTSLPEKLDDACLNFFIIPGTTTAHNLFGQISLVEG